MEKKSRYPSIFLVAIGVGAAIVRSNLSDEPGTDSDAQTFMSYVGIVSLCVVIFMLLHKLNKSVYGEAMSRMSTFKQESVCKCFFYVSYVLVVLAISTCLIIYLVCDIAQNDVVAIVALTLSVTTDWIVSDFGKPLGVILAFIPSRIKK